VSRARYTAWDGSQDPIGDELPVDELVDRLSEDVLDGWDIDDALRRMLRDGLDGRFDGLREMRERIRRMREEASSRRALPEPLGAFRERLEEITDLERGALAGDPGDDARFAELTLDALPENTAARIRELREYEWRSEEAQEAFEGLLDDIRRSMLDASFRRMSDALRDTSPEELGRLKDMLAELNEMLEERANGTGPSQERFDAFMDRHGDFFPERPRTFDELLEVLARRGAAFSRYLASLTPDQREELQGLVEDLLGDMDLAFQMDRMAGNLRALAPDLGWDTPSGMPTGGEPVGLGEGLAMIEEESRLEELERALGQDYPGASLEDVDPEALRQTLGPGAGRDLERLRAIERMLEEAGVVARAGGRLELTPRGVRKLGERALTRVFERLAVDQAGSHETSLAGGADEPTGSSRPWRFGDSFRLDLRRTLHNAVLRSGPTSGPVSLHPDDFEIEEAERRTSVATVLLLDMSRSMPLRGHWLPAKRMALALHTLISTTYPEDRLSIVGFSDYAREMTPADLAQVDWEPVYGTNMEHAFNLANRLLSRHRDASKQVLLVTDGEPTAHLEGEHVFFHWPPVRETLERTYREALRLSRSGVTTNIFMLEQSPGLVAFIDRLARLVDGRVFAAGGDELGDLVVTDYVRRR
jgi:uncharacterized protein with von Willebrand factor type A (vWA) domain